MTALVFYRTKDTLHRLKRFSPYHEVLLPLCTILTIKELIVKIAALKPLTTCLFRWMSAILFYVPIQCRGT